jgi:hypothetical protein
VVTEYWSSFRDRLEALGRLPKFVEREVDEHLRCGILEYGFVRVKYKACYARTVPNVFPHVFSMVLRDGT